MRKIKFLLLFGMVLVSFTLSGCSGTKWIWCTSNGILTYNRHTGQFEMLWENSATPIPVVHDTVYVERDPNSNTAGER